MKRNIFILPVVLCILAISTLILFAEEAKYDFRKTNWGMSEEQVRAIEDKEPDTKDITPLGFTTLGYKVEIDSIDEKSTCYYNFLEDKLYQGAYIFYKEHTNKNYYIDDYKKLKEILTKKYGKPKIDKVIWKNDLYKSDKSQWGMAISVGHLTYEASWETSTTKIDLTLNSIDFDLPSDINNIFINMVYDSRELKEWADKIMEEKRNKIMEERAKDF